VENVGDEGKKVGIWNRCWMLNGCKFGDGRLLTGQLNESMPAPETRYSFFSG
jgi:hypothetical protein